MTPIQQPNRAPIGAWAMPHSKGKASQRPAFTPTQPSPSGLISRTTVTNAHKQTCLTYWQGDIDTGPFDCSVSLQPVMELRE